MVSVKTETSGSFDFEAGPRAGIIRIKAIVLALKIYGPTPAEEQLLCQCPSCRARRAERG